MEQRAHEEVLVNRFGCDCHSRACVQICVALDYVGYYKSPKAALTVGQVPRSKIVTDMIVSSESNPNSYGAERRSCGRQRVLFSSVVLNEGNCGRVLNISPNGLALQTDTELVGQEFPFRFKFSPSLAWVEAKGRVAWRNDSKNVVGIEFISLTDEVQRQIRTWMDWKKESTEPLKKDLPGAPLNGGPRPNELTATHEHFVDSEMWNTAPGKIEDVAVNGENQKQANQTSEFLFPPTTSADLETASQKAPETTPAEYDFASLGTASPGVENQSLPSMTAAREPSETQEFSRSGEVKSASGIGTQIKLIGLALLIIFMLSVILFRRNHSQTPSKGSQSSTAAVRTPRPPARTDQATPPAAIPPVKSVGAVSPAASPAVPHASDPKQNPTAHGPAFVLQVAAMLHEENANALATTLRDSNFPAFVMKLPTERFHHVLVGPFNTASAAMETQSKLEQKGYKPIRTEWKVSSH